METKGDLNGAINLFNDIIKKYPKEREYAAKSQLYIGLCYEKLGVKEAQKAYELVVSEYADQKEMVALAKERLAALGKPGDKKEFVTQQILEKGRCISV
jgi:TolA-binding protein